VPDGKGAAGPDRIAQRTRFHLDDFGAKVGEVAAYRGRRQLRDLEHPDPG
jgi:hypothetical protein